MQLAHQRRSRCQIWEEDLGASWLPCTCTRPSDLHMANYHLQEIFNFVAFLWFWEKVPEVSWVYYTGNCAGTLIYRSLSSTGGTYVFAAVIKCRKTIKENQLNTTQDWKCGCCFQAPPPTTWQISFAYLLGVLPRTPKIAIQLISLLQKTE